MDPFANSNPTNRVSVLRHSLGKFVSERSGKYNVCHSSNDNFVLTLAWIVSGLFTVFVPLIYRTIHKKKYREIYMSYYWEQEYEQYQEQRQQNYEMYGNQYNYGGAYMYEGNQREYIDVNNCKWWNFNCFSFFVNQDGEPMADQEWAPAWYSGFMTTEEEREQMQQNLEQPGSLKFVYIWQFVMFLVIGWYGLVVIRQNRNPTGLIVALLVWANFAFLTMWLMADGSIVTDGDQAQRTGFYGQLSVLIFMTNFWYFLHGLVFMLVFLIRSSCLTEQEKREKEEKDRQFSETQDNKYNAPVTKE